MKIFFVIYLILCYSLLLTLTVNTASNNEEPVLREQAVTIEQKDNLKDQNRARKKKKGKGKIIKPPDGGADVILTLDRAREAEDDDETEE